MATMRKIGIRQLRDNLSKELKDLPLAIASDGQVVATILSIEGYKRLLEGYKNTDSSHNVIPDALQSKSSLTKTPLNTTTSVQPKSPSVQPKLRLFVTSIPHRGDSVQPKSVIPNKADIVEQVRRLYPDKHMPNYPDGRYRADVKPKGRERKMALNVL